MLSIKNYTELFTDAFIAVKIVSSSLIPKSDISGMYASPHLCLPWSQWLIVTIQMARLH